MGLKTRTRFFTTGRIWLVSATLVAIASQAWGQSAPHWPTPSKAFWNGASLESILQPTASGRWESGLFGCVRNNGNRFHEGIDIAPENRDRYGEATDPILAFYPGVIVHLSPQAHRSSYGRYIVIEHPDANPAVYSLYAHLKSIHPDLRVGDKVQAGQRIGVMGRSASGYTIPKQRAHLHFEIGLRLSNRFDSWFNRQGFQSPNDHANFNGMNLVGLDPLDFFQKYRYGQVSTLTDYFQQLPTDFTIHYSTSKLPMLLARYPGLLSGRANPKQLVGWNIDFTWYGLPLKFTPVEGDPATIRESQLRILSFNTEAFRENRCAQTLRVQSNGTAIPGKNLIRNLQLIFE